MIRQLLEEARRRLLYHQLAAQFTLAVSLVLGAFILLLLAGTQMLDWRVLAALAACGVIIGLIRTMRRLPSLYEIAVLIDRRACLFDALSTAWIFERGEGTANPAPEVLAIQRSQAEAAASDVDLEAALPYTIPRAAYAMAALFLVATSLFALRYGMSHNLDLKPPLVSVVMDALGWTPAATAEKAKRKTENKMASLLKQLGISTPEPGEKMQASNLDPATDQALETITDPDYDNSASRNPPGAKTEEASIQNKDGDPSTDPEESSQGDQASAGKGNPEDSGNNDNHQGEQQASKPGNSSDNSSLMSKIKDALNNMMSKSKSQKASGGQKSQSQMAQSQNGTQNSDKGQPGQGQKDGGKESTEAAQDGQQQGESETAQNSPGKGGGKSNDRDAAAQPGSGIGRQDGAKDLRAAQQEKAMGKLSEVIGKRSANVTGEMTVEVQSSSQQLRTGYSQTSAQHAAAGGELSRDEVPLDLQPYVSGYFDEIRKQPAKAK